MKKLAFILLTLCFTLVATRAQTPRFINLELLGVHNLVGVSFDSRFNENSKFGYKAGLGYGYASSTTFLGDDWSSHAISLPLSAYYLLGNKSHHFDLGAGIALGYERAKGKISSPWGFPATPFEENAFYFLPFLQTAYRYESSKIPFLFSVGIDIPFTFWGANSNFAIGFAPKLAIGYRL